MGNRAKGRVKKKSIKAALGSNAGSKRKLSRMGKKQKKDHAGLAATFIGRAKCLKMLQISIKDFRRLCILKGIYPRQPIGKTPGNKKGQTYYHIKDIRAIAHEPVLEKFRDFRAYMKKVRRAAGRNEKDEAIRKNGMVPTYTIHHLVKERYPRFVDALSDLDDALTLSYLFAALPADKSISAKVSTKAKNLVAAWGAYCATTGSVTKSFISVKGIYMEASIQATPIRWIIPHSFTQYMPEDVDYRVMQTFFEFYETLLNFVLFKLYSDIGVRYPFPAKEIASAAAGSTSAALGVNLRALRNALNPSENSLVAQADSTVSDQKPSSKHPKKTDHKLIESVGDVLKKLNKSGVVEEEDDEESVDVAGPLQEAMDAVAGESGSSIPGGSVFQDDNAIGRRRIFQGFTFFLSREVPRGYLELVCLAFGGKVGWEGDDSPISIRDPSITHHVCDRPKLPSSYSSLPKSREFIQPQWILDCSNFLLVLPLTRYAVGSALPPHLSPWVDNEEEGYVPDYAKEIERLRQGLPPEEAAQEVDDNASVDTPEEIIEEVEQESEASEMEEDSKEVRKKKQKKRKKEQEEEHELAKTMMSRKATHLYGRMQHGVAKKQAKVDLLNQRRKDLGHTKEKDTTGKSFDFQKVERLREERRTVEKTYTDTGGTMRRSKRGKKK